MSLQIRPQIAGGAGNEAAFYAPARDVAHILPSLLGALVDHFVNEIDCPDFESTHGATTREVAETLKKFADFINLCIQESATAVDCYDKAELGSCSPRGLDCVCRAVTQAILGVYYKGKREITYSGGAPSSDVTNFVGSAIEFVKLCEGKDSAAPGSGAKRTGVW